FHATAEFHIIRSVVQIFLTVLALPFPMRRFRNAWTRSESISPIASFPNAGRSVLLMWPFSVALVDAFLWIRISDCQRSTKSANGVAPLPIVALFTANGWELFGFST